VFVLQKNKCHEKYSRKNDLSFIFLVMKVVKRVFFTIILFLLGVFNALADGPPVPSPTGKKKLPPPPGLPIDDNIFILLIIAVLFGIYIIYSFRLKTKTPI
jgi:hypothetical protein